MVRIFAKLIVLFLLVYAGVSFWYDRLEKTLLQSPEIAEKPEMDTAPVEKTEITRQPNDYSIIVGRNIFQAVVTKVKKDPEVVVEKKPIEPTKLKLSLMGTISGNEQDARAIISDEVKRKQDIYQVGDSIQGGLIKSIERGKVVLSVNNRDEILTLSDREGGGPAYNPSPTDFYKEPAQEGPDVQKVPGRNQQSPVQQATQPTVQKRPTTVRPRPVRRSLHLRQRQEQRPETEEGPEDIDGSSKY